MLPPNFSVGSLGLLVLGFRFQGPGNFSLFAAILGAVQGVLAVAKLESVVSGLLVLCPFTFLPIPLLDHIFIVLKCNSWDLLPWDEAKESSH